MGGNRAKSRGTLLWAGALGILLWSASGCSSAPEEAAYLINALANDLEIVSGEYTVPESMECNDRKYTFDGGNVVTGFGTPAADVELVMDIDIDARGPDVFSISYDDGEDDPSFVCNAHVLFEYDATTNKPVGNGVVVDCDDYKCVVNGIKVTCAELTEALPKFGCN